MSIESELKDLILSKYKSLREFTITIDMPYSTLDTILKRGVNKANVANIISICKELNIDVEELGKGRIVFKDEESSNITEARLAIHNVPMDRDYIPKTKLEALTSKDIELLDNFHKLNDIGQYEATKRVKELTLIDKYTIKENSNLHLLPNAAHEIEGASEEDKAHDDAIMDDDNF